MPRGKSLERVPGSARTRARAQFQQFLGVCILVSAVGHLTLCVDELGLFIPSVGPSLPPAIVLGGDAVAHEIALYCRSDGASPITET